MHDYNTIIGVIGLRNDKVSYPVIRRRYGIGNSGIDLIMNRYKDSAWETGYSGSISNSVRKLSRIKKNVIMQI